MQPKEFRTPEFIAQDFRHRSHHNQKNTAKKNTPVKTKSSRSPYLPLDEFPYFCNSRNMNQTRRKASPDQIARFADMFSAIGTEARLRIMQALLSAHPEGLVVTDIQDEIDIPNSTLSHHLEKLKNEDLVKVQRESTFLRYTANTEVLQELLRFLYAECCTRNKALKAEEIIQVCR
jgi:ArsR family transcriptional regulator, arsenate/arsenite/antimonite-responsive transcriptional repressor